MHLRRGTATKLRRNASHFGAARGGRAAPHRQKKGFPNVSGRGAGKNLFCGEVPQFFLGGGMAEVCLPPLVRQARLSCLPFVCLPSAYVKGNLLVLSNSMLLLKNVEKSDSFL